MGYLHKITTSNGTKFGYSLFYNYENIVNKLWACKYFFDRNQKAEWVPVEGKEALQFAADATHSFKDNDYAKSVTGKVVVNHNSVKTYTNLKLKGHGDLFDSLELSTRLFVNKIYFNFVQILPKFWLNFFNLFLFWSNFFYFFLFIFIS